MFEIIGIIAAFILGGYLSLALFGAAMLILGLGGTTSDKFMLSLGAAGIGYYWYIWVASLPFEIVVKVIQ